MIALALAAAAAVFLGAMTVATRLVLGRQGNADVGAAAIVLGGLVVALATAIVEASHDGARIGQTWPFALAGLLAPGAGSIFVTRAVREVGASRASVVFGTGPGVSVAIALIFLGEPFKLALIGGGTLIVVGALALGREPERPSHLRAIGLAFALTGTVLFSVRDALIRWLSLGVAPPPGVASAVTLASGWLLIALVLYRRLRRHPWRAWIPFLPVGALFGISYVLVFEAYYRGRVEIVAPLVATESMWAVLFAKLLLSGSEAIQRNVLIGAACVVGGGVLIGAFR